MQSLVHTLSLIVLSSLLLSCTGGGKSSSVAEASVMLGAIQDEDILIVRPSGRIDHYDADSEFVGSLFPAIEPGENCVFGLVQNEDVVVLVENCVAEGSVTQLPLLAIGLDGLIVEVDLSGIDCPHNCAILRFDMSAVPLTTHRVMPIAGQLSDTFYDNTGQELSYVLRLDGFFDGSPGSEVSFGGDLLFKTFSGGCATMTGEVTVNSIDHGLVPPELIESGEAGPYDVSVLFRQVTGSNPAYTYYEIIPAGRELVNVDDVTDTVHMVTFPFDGAAPFQVGVGANQKNQEYGAAGWLNYEHLRFGDDGSLLVDGCLGDHIYASDFLMNLVEIDDGDE